MHNRALHDTLAAFVEEAAWQLAEEVSGGAEVPFELIEQGRSSAPLYCYKPLTQRFLAERSGALGRLGSYVPAVQGLMAVPDLPSYLRARGRRPSGSDPRSLADAALQAFVAAVWQDATDFSFDDARFAAAYAELEDAVYDGCALSLVVTPVDGLVIESPEVSLGGGLTLVRGVDVSDGPPELRGDEFATVAVLTLESQPGDEQGLDAAGRRLRRLQSALRLWDDAEPALGPTAWARTDGAPWLRDPAGHRPAPHDRRLPARPGGRGPAARVLLARRPPHPAVGRARLGAAPVRARLRARHGARGADGLAAVRPRAAGRARRVGYERMAERIAAICATPAERDALVDGLRRAIAMERAVVAGLVRPEPVVEEMVASLGSCLRAILRDVLCGHLDPDLRRVADGLLADVAPVPSA